MYQYLESLLEKKKSSLLLIRVWMGGLPLDDLPFGAQNVVP